MREDDIEFWDVLIFTDMVELFGFDSHEEGKSFRQEDEVHDF